MSRSKLGLDFNKVDMARGLAKNIAEDVQGFVDSYTTVAVERTICRLLGIDGVDADEVPLPNIIVDHLKDKGILNEGVMYFIGNAILETNLSPQQIAEKVSSGEIDLSKLPTHSKEDVKATIEPIVNESVERIRKNREVRENYIEKIGEGD
ncbi:MAG: lysine 5,6-aminomutase subunit alpha, partial [Cetobacterium sp.]